MNAKEIMLGNYVEFEGQLHQVIGITEDEINLSRKSDSGKSNITYWVGIYSLKPIPLTEKWLLDFGFNKNYKIGYIGIDFKSGNITTDFVLTYPLKRANFEKYFIWQHSKFKYNELKYVHELQNLFFILTNNNLQLVG